MGGAYMAQSMPGETAEEAHQALLAWFASEYEDGGWRDPAEKGYIQVWPEPVEDYAVGWMRGWVEQHPPAVLVEDAERRARTDSARYGWEVKPELFDKYGPWLAFPLAAGGWHFFGVVNT